MVMADVLWNICGGLSLCLLILIIKSVRVK